MVTIRSKKKIAIVISFFKIIIYLIKINIVTYLSILNKDIVNK